MAIESIRPSTIGTIEVNTSGERAARQTHSEPERAGNADAIRVELSEPARRAAERSAVTATNSSAAASADFLASREGRQLLTSILPLPGRRSLRA
jgi:hypothetical protein